MNSGDVFILDCGEGIFQWNGAASNGYERARAAEFVASLHEERAKATVTVFEEGSPRTLDPELPFAKYLPVLEADLGGASPGVLPADKGGDDAGERRFRHTLVQLVMGETAAESAIKKVGEGKLERSMLRSEGVYVVDDGFRSFLWVGANASFRMRTAAFPFAQQYLKDYARPAVLPLTRYAEGDEHPKFWRCFVRDMGYRIDAAVSKERVHPALRKNFKKLKAEDGIHVDEAEVGGRRRSRRRRPLRRTSA